MSEIQGLGSIQPLRPTPQVGRPNAPQAEVETESPSSFGSDAVQVSAQAPALASTPAPSEAPARQVQAWSVPLPESPRVEEVDGFIVAGAPQAPAAPSRSPEPSRTFGSGPIAVIEEPSAALPAFPNLALNGPSTSSEGLFSLAGQRLA